MVLAIDDGGVKRVHRASIAFAQGVAQRAVDEERDADGNDKLDSAKDIRDEAKKREHASSDRKPAEAVPRPRRQATTGAHARTHARTHALTRRPIAQDFPLRGRAAGPYAEGHANLRR